MPNRHLQREHSLYKVTNMPSQVERKAATRRVLLDAAGDCLVADGLVGFTTSAVTNGAGMSNGALFGHFPTRLDLLSATVEHVLTRLRIDYDTTFGQLDSELDARVALELLWAAMSDAQFCALLEIYTLARTDADVGAAMLPIVTRHGEYVHGLVVRVATAIADESESLDQLVSLGHTAILAMQGLVVGQMAGASPGHESEVIASFAGQIDRLLDRPTSHIRS